MTAHASTEHDALRAEIRAAQEHHRRTPEMIRGVDVPYHRRGELVVPAFRMKPGGDPESDGRTESLRVMQKAATLDADMVFIDLEDASPDHPEYKLLGRRFAVEALTTILFGNRVVGFRPNNIRTPYFEDDLIDILTHAGNRLQVMVIPKTQSADEIREITGFVRRVQELSGHSNPISLEVLIESPAAFLDAERIAALGGVTALAFGAWDFARTIGGSVDAARWLTDQGTVRQMLPVIAAAYGKEAVDAVTATIPARPQPPFPCTGEEFAAALASPPADLDSNRWGMAFIDRLRARQDALALARRDAADARRCGFAAKWILHPDQITPIQEAWTPTAARAREALQMAVRYAVASQRGSGAEAYGTLMTDKAVVGAEWWTVHAALRAGILTQEDILATGHSLAALETALKQGTR
jgi:citrate lyase subunit beta/citryl-CoA lyase